MATAEVKLYELAAANPTLQGIFGTSPFRWYDTQIPQGIITPGSTAAAWAQKPALRILRVSTIFAYEMAGLNPLNQPRFQIDILHPLAETARAAAAAVRDWLGTVDLAGTYQFGSPTTTPPQFPCFVVSQRGGLAYEFEPPVYVQTLDFRVFNLEE